MSTSAYDAMMSYLASTTPTSDALRHARAEVNELGVTPPEETTGQLVATITAVATSGKTEANVVAITPASSVVGLHILPALPAKGVLTCINPEAAHNNAAKAAFRNAGFSPAQSRFLTARPLDVMGRLAHNTYQMVYADVAALDLPAVIRAAWPLLTVGGTLILVDSLLDGTLADSTRTDRDTVAAREADAAVFDIEDATVTRLPLGAGLTLVTRRA